jgi:hypothetical protein
MSETTDDSQQTIDRSDQATSRDNSATTTDQYGTVVKHVGVCSSCDRREVDDGTQEGFGRVFDRLSTHIDDGTACHEFRVEAIYEDGSGRSVA